MKIYTFPGLRLFAILLFITPSLALAQAYPNKAIRFVLGPAPDLLPRLIGQKLSETWGQQVVIDQRLGAGGIIAAEIVAKAPPDGYTWFMSSGAMLTVAALYSRISYNVERDFTPVTLMATLPWILVVNPSVPAKSLTEFIQLARARPGQINYGNPGTGTSTHLVTEMFKTMAKINIVDVPYKGVVPAVLATLGGEVKVMFAIAQAGLPHVRSEKLRALAITSAKRYAAAPEIPTIAESGFRDMDVVGWNGVHVPAKTPRAIIDTINHTIGGILKSRAVQERMLAAGFETAMTSVEDFDAFVKADMKRYAKVIKESGVRVE